MFHSDRTSTRSRRRLRRARARVARPSGASAIECLEPRRPLAVNVVFTPPPTGGTDAPSLTLTCSEPDDQVELAISGDFETGTGMSWQVMGVNGTIITGPTTGVWTQTTSLTVGSIGGPLPDAAFLLVALDDMGGLMAGVTVPVGALTMADIGSVQLGPAVWSVATANPRAVQIAAGSVSLGGTLTASFATNSADLATSEYLGADITIVATEGGIFAEGIAATPSLGPFPDRVRPPANGTLLPGGTVRLNADTEISVSGAILVAAGTFTGDTFDLDEDDASGLGGFVSLLANEQISTGAIVGSQGTSIDQDGPDPVASAARAPATLQARPTPAAGAAASPPAIGVASIRGSGPVLVKASRGPIHLGGDVTTGPRGSAPASVTFDGDLVLTAPVRVHATVASVGSGPAGDVTFTGRIDGRHPLAIAAGAGAVSFGDMVGGVRPLAGLRIESAGRVKAGDRVHLAGGTADAFRHGIEIAPGVTDVHLSRGGTLRNFPSGHAIHLPGGSSGSTISGFRIVNSGHPFAGWGGSESTAVLRDNVVVRPVPRPKASVPTLVGGSSVGGIQSTNDTTPTFSGRARTGDTVTLYADGMPAGSAVAANGRWSITSQALAEGRRTIRVRTLAPNGVASGFSPPRSIRIAPVTTSLGVLRTTVERPVAAGALPQIFTFTTRGTGGRFDRILLTGRSSIEGRITLELRDGMSHELLESTSVRVDSTERTTKNPTQILLSGLPAGSYALHVRVADADAQFAVPGGGDGLSIRFDAPAPDAAGSGSDDTRETATHLGLSEETIRARSLIDDAVDWYSFDMPVAGDRTIVFRHAAPARAVTVLELSDAAGDVVARSSGPGGVQAIRGVSLAAGRYFVRVSQHVGGKHAVAATDPYTFVVTAFADPEANAVRMAAPDPVATAARRVTLAGWARSHLPSSAVRALVLATADEGRAVISRATILGIFDAVESDGTVTANEFRSLAALVRNTTVVDMPDFVRNLAQKTVLGNPGNATFQGQPLGNLGAGSGSQVLAHLVDKWFLGGDVPLSPIDKATGQPLYPTMRATGTLFGPGGVPRVEDISQGDTGDCYLLSSLGTIVSRMGEPGGSHVISLASPGNPDGMFIANGDGTHTVRFHLKAQEGPDAGTWVPDYVTVNDEFLVYPNDGDPEWLFANAYGVFARPDNVLWVAYAEKAFVQFVGGLGGSFANDYEAINGAFDANITLMAITGRDGYVASQDLAARSFEEIVAAFDRGVGAVFSTLATTPPVDTAPDVPLVSNHDYMMIGYDPGSRTIRLRNPWGDALDSAGFTGVRGTYDAVAGASSAPGFTSLVVSATIDFLRTNFDAWYHV